MARLRNFVRKIFLRGFRAVLFRMVPKHEVIQGVWGNGEERYNSLANAGYDPQAVQDKVNELLS